METAAFKDIVGYSYIDALTKLLEAYVPIYKKFEFIKDSNKISSISRDAFMMEYGFCRNEANNLKHNGLLSIAESIARNFISNLALMLYYNSVRFASTPSPSRQVFAKLRH